jgi:Spy/CpxP family protein refolding chaperone
MKSLKVLISVITLGLLASASISQAADGGGKGKGQQSPEQQVAALDTAVGGLTADQKTKIAAVYAKAADALRAVPKEERKEKAAGMLQKTRGEVRALLTAEQQAKFDKMGGGGKKKN